MPQLCTFVMTENILKLKRYYAFSLLRPIRKMEMKRLLHLHELRTTTRSCTFSIHIGCKTVIIYGGHSE